MDYLNSAILQRNRKMSQHTSRHCNPYFDYRQLMHKASRYENRKMSRLGDRINISSH